MNILLLHGALGTKREIAPLAAALPNLRTRALDFSGHGERAIPAQGLSFEAFVSDIGDALDAARWEQAHLFGYSMGGYAAMRFAARFPERVRSVATLGTKYIWTPEGLRQELGKLDPEKIEAKVPHFAKALSLAHGQERWKEVVRATATLLTGLAATPLLTDEVLATVRCPALLCVGDRDTTAVPEDTLATARKLPDAGAWVLPRTRHPFHEVDMDALVAQLTRFWAGVPAPSA